MPIIAHSISILILSIVMAGPSAPAFANAGHKKAEPGHNDVQGMMNNLREQHQSHEHGHDFEAMESMSPEKLERMISLMQDVGLVVPEMNPVRGRDLFVNTGCIVCHSVNGVGGDIGPSLNAADLPSPMNTFEFAARMWRGAAAMTAMQQDILGDVIPLTGQDLADLIAFAHDSKEQEKLTEDQIPQKFKDMIAQ